MWNENEHNWPVKIELNAYAANVVAMTANGSSSPISVAILVAITWKNGYVQWWKIEQFIFAMMKF